MVSGKGGDDPAAARKARLAAALRENLKRRKAQARGKPGPPKAPGEGPRPAGEPSVPDQES